MTTQKAHPYLLLSAILLALLFIPFLPATAQEERGVPLKLADLREQTISQPAYHLNFTIPKEGVVKGEAIISFVSKTRRVVLDFQADANQLHTIMVNGQKANATVVNEHIVLPRSLIRKGKNTVALQFTAGDKALNRHTDFLYTLLVPDKARMLFPCFDQPNLKAQFTLTLTVPNGWCAVSNTAIVDSVSISEGMRYTFGTTRLLPTYLFSFVVGRFQKTSTVCDGLPMTAYYRETDTAKVSQLPEVFRQIAYSKRWLEDYTGIKMPFEKYDFIMIPGFQFGGMEHPGAVLYKHNSIFLGPTPTPDELLRRAELLAHETTHYWFGDLVTMRWFNDVWTKEVFANYLAAKIMQPLYPDIDHPLNFLRSYQTRALTEDRTQGTHPIQQPLDNLNNAGLLYGNIIYCKAPVMMRKLEETIGEKNFRDGLSEYLKTYSYGNATWDNLVNIFAKKDPRVLQFNDVWVKSKGLPTISCEAKDGILTVRETDPYGRGCRWTQRLKLKLVYNDDEQTDKKDAQIHPQTPYEIKEVTMGQGDVRIPVSDRLRFVIPNCDGSTYGRFVLDDRALNYLLATWAEEESAEARMAALMNIYENRLMHRCSDEQTARSLLRGLKWEQDPLVASACCNYMSSVMSRLHGEPRLQMERKMWYMSLSHSLVSCRQRLVRSLFSLATDTTLIAHLYDVWQQQSNKQLNERDYTSLAYQLAIRRPAEWRAILDTQRSRLTSADRKEEFDFISRACTPDVEERRALFRSLLKKENRKVEPWAASLLSLLNHPLRQQQALEYILPGLNVLEEVQRTGDIFFAKDWVMALLAGHDSDEAKHIVETFVETHPNYPPALRNKLLQAAYPLLNR
ncbi:M1 family metallopeptidase [Hoylesella marshii]|uniref:Aminopeptidase N n=1 Tax=Hoylesella marshii DSM 16973 = JCM 13450 TaxID=862515 RepID=E0NS58_9BACT|nr:M1 family aminopeptidase [Hoylesella marshii]EFM02021.1 peptidase family M1 [Hoylesella marshii DSM 16973 = JCM 13450]